MTENTNPKPVPSLEDQITAEGVEIAKAALGIPEHARVIPFDLHAQPLVVILRDTGVVDLFATISRENVIANLRLLADELEAQS